MPRQNQIQLRKGTYNQWDAQSSTVLGSGEPGFITDFNKLKIGDGTTQWSDLSAINDALTTLVYNGTASTIPKMSVVYINGAQGDMPSIRLSIASGEMTSSKTYGITTNAISAGGTGMVVVDGALKNLNTSPAFDGVTPGTTLWLSPTVSGGITTTKPSGPNHMVSVGNLIRVHNQQGIINVKIQNGFELEELHNVAVSGVSDGQFLYYNSSSGLWQPNSTIYGSGNNIGIGTTTPGAKLHVNGDLLFEGGSLTFDGSTLNVAGLPNNDPVAWGDPGIITAGMINGPTTITLHPYTSDSNFEGGYWGGGVISLLTADSAGSTPSLAITPFGFVFGDSTVQNTAWTGSVTSSEITDFNSSVSGLFPTDIVRTTGNQTMSGDLTIGGNLTVNGTTITANVDTMTIEDPIITLGLASGNIVPVTNSDRGLALVRGTGLTAFMGWDTSASQFVMLSSGIAGVNSGTYTAGTYGDLQLNKLNSAEINVNELISIISSGISFSNFIKFNDTSTASSPSLGSVSNGTRLLLNENNDNGHNAIGIQYAGINGTWFSVPSGGTFTFYNGTSSQLTLNSTSLNYGSFIASPDGSITSASWNASTIAVNKGGTGRTSYSNGQLLIGSGTSLVANALTAGTGISIVNGSGTITINTSGLQTSLTNPVTGTGTNGKIPKWSSTSGLTDSILTEASSVISIAGSFNGTLDDSYLSFDANARRIGITKKGGFTGKFTYGSGSSFAIAQSNITTIEAINTFTDRLIIDPSGRVGIGTSSPTSQLHVVGSGLFSGDATASGSFIGGSGTASLPSFEFVNDPDTGLFSPAANAFGISTSGVERLRVDSSGNIGIGTSSPTYKLQVNGNFGATTKSFRIDHPSKPGYSLEYGSLESPYHGVRLTGRDKVIKGIGVVMLPDYLKDLIHDDESLTIQLTNYKHGKTLYISKIDLGNDQFIVKADRSKTLGELEFFWSLTGTRKDVENLVVEKRN
jgi:hypothetical protein